MRVDGGESDEAIDEESQGKGEEPGVVVEGGEEVGEVGEADGVEEARDAGGDGDEEGEDGDRVNA